MAKCFCTANYVCTYCKEKEEQGTACNTCNNDIDVEKAINDLQVQINALKVNSDNGNDANDLLAQVNDIKSQLEDLKECCGGNALIGSLAKKIEEAAAEMANCGLPEDCKPTDAKIEKIKKKLADNFVKNALSPSTKIITFENCDEMAQFNGSDSTPMEDGILAYVKEDFMFYKLELEEQDHDNNNQGGIQGHCGEDGEIIVTPKQNTKVAKWVSFDKAHDDYVVNVEIKDPELGDEDKIGLKRPYYEVTYKGDKKEYIPTYRYSINHLDNAPDSTYDVTKGFVIGSVVKTPDGTTYICTDNAKDNAQWREALYRDPDSNDSNPKWHRGDKFKNEASGVTWCCVDDVPGNAVWIKQGDSSQVDVGRDPDSNDGSNECLQKGQAWKNTSSGEEFEARDVTPGNAKWIKTKSNTIPDGSYCAEKGYRKGDVISVGNDKYALIDPTCPNAIWAKVYDRDPIKTDDGSKGFAVGDSWYNGATGTLFYAKSVDNGDAVWCYKQNGVCNVRRDRTPTDNDDNFDKNDTWVDTSTGNAYSFDPNGNPKWQRLFATLNDLKDPNLNPQSDWNETDPNSVAYIKNKPQIPDAVEVPKVECGVKDGVPTAGDFTGDIKLIVDISDNGGGKCYKLAGGVVKEVK